MTTNKEIMDGWKKTWTDEELKDAFPIDQGYTDDELVFFEGFYKKQLAMLKAEQERREKEVKNERVSTS